MQFFETHPLPRRLRSIAFFVVAAGAFVGAAPASAVPVGTLDSSCTRSGTNGFAGISGGFAGAQTFTAGASGKVLYVEVEGVARNTGGAGGNINVELLGVDTGGTPVVSPLATTAIPAAQITADGAPHTLSATFSPASAHRAVAGTSYAIALNTADTAQNAWYIGSNACPGAIYWNSNGGPFAPGFGGGEDSGLAVYLGPANDDFAHAQVLSGSATSVNGTILGATGETGDAFTTEDQSSTGRSVWYRWTAAGSGPTTVDTCTTNYDSLLAVFTGAGLGALTPVVTNNNNCPTGFGSKVTFDAVQGTTYHLDVDGCCGLPEGTFTLALSGQPAPPPVAGANPPASPPATPAAGISRKACKKAKKRAAAAAKCKKKRKK